MTVSSPTDSVIEHIRSSSLTQEQRDIVAACADAWLSTFGAERPDVVAAESPFYLWLDAKTLLVGVIDRLTDEDGLVTANEYKTKRAPRIKKDGQPYKGDSRQEWIDALANGPQCRIYALAANKGTLCPTDGPQVTPQVTEPRVRVRAVNKPEQPIYEGGRLVAFKRPAEVWTADDDAPFVYSPALCYQTEVALLAKAHAIRALRRYNPDGPWALPSIHCTNKFGRLCEYWEPHCGPRTTPKGQTRFDPADPGSAAIQHSGADLSDPDLVIFSASSFESAQWCDERYRILMLDGTVKEEGEALLIGKVFHECVAIITRNGGGA